MNLRYKFSTSSIIEGGNINRESNHLLLESEDPGVIDSVMFGKYTVTCDMLQFNQLSSGF